MNLTRKMITHPIDVVDSAMHTLFVFWLICPRQTVFFMWSVKTKMKMLTSKMIDEYELFQLCYVLGCSAAHFTLCIKLRTKCRRKKRKHFLKSLNRSRIFVGYLVKANNNSRFAINDFQSEFIRFFVLLWLCRSWLSMFIVRITEYFGIILSFIDHNHYYYIIQHICLVNAQITELFCMFWAHVIENCS